MSSDNKTLTNSRSICVLIPDSDGSNTTKVLRCLGKVPHVTTHILSKTRFPMERFSRYCTSCVCHTSESDDEWIDVIRNLAQKLRIDVVLPVTDKGVEFVVRNQSTFLEFTAIPTVPTLDPLKTVQDKWAFYRFGKERGLPMVPSIQISDNRGVILYSPELDSIEYPALLKPTSLGGGYGIVRVEKASDLQCVWEDKRVRKDLGYVLQNYVPGVDVCVQVFCKHGKILAYTVQKSLLPSDDHFGSQRIMEFVEGNEAVELGSRLISTMKFEGMACIDYRIDARDQTWKILEFSSLVS